MSELLYAGIGSRETPPDVLIYMRKVAKRLAELDFVLRSGAADGADAAFEAGCDDQGGAKEIWLPWAGFNGHADTGFYPGPQHFALASTLHPAWAKLGQGPRNLHARNVGQVVGSTLAEPVSFVLCWTADGCESEATRSRHTGGTGTAISLASQKGIPVLNLRNPEAQKRLAKLVLSKTDSRTNAKE